MSKKMMKRSLALGVLMAFVITGNAMAEELTDATTIHPRGWYAAKCFAFDIEPVGTVTRKYRNVVSSKSINVNVTKEVAADLIGLSVYNSVTNTGNVRFTINANDEDMSINLLNTGTGDVEGIMVHAENSYSGYSPNNGAAFANINVNKLTVNATGNASVTGLWVGHEINGSDSIVAKNEGNSTLTINAVQTDITVKSTGKDASGTEVMSGANLVINGNVSITANGAGENNSRVILAHGNSTIKIGGYDVNEKAYDVKLKGDIVFGSFPSSSRVMNAWVDLQLNSEASNLEGAIYQYDKDENRIGLIDRNQMKGMQLGLSNGATWTVTDNSWVNTLNGDGGIIALKEVSDGVLAKVEILTADNSKNLTVQQAGVTADTVKDQQAHLEALAAAVVDADGSAADKLFIEEGLVVGAVTAEVTADGKAGKAVEAVNTVNKSIGEASVVGMAHIRARMNDMNKRMGELRMAGESGVWTRMVRGEEEFAGAKSQYNQYQLGYDEKLSVDKRWTVGAAVTFAEGNGNFANGSTENYSTAFAIYGSKLNNDGTFVDLIARYARFESDITVADAKADYSTNGKIGRAHV